MAHPLPRSSSSKASFRHRGAEAVVLCANRPPIPRFTRVGGFMSARKKSDVRKTESSDEPDPRESGQPGGGAGRRDEVGPTGVYPMSGGIPADKHLEIRTPAAWGQGERGAEGYNDAGGSELVMRDGQLLGGLTAGPGGEPTIDIHGGDVPPDSQQVGNADQGASPEIRRPRRRKNP